MSSAAQRLVPWKAKVAPCVQGLAVLREGSVSPTVEGSQPDQEGLSFGGDHGTSPFGALDPRKVFGGELRLSGQDAHAGSDDEQLEAALGEDRSEMVGGRGSPRRRTGRRRMPPMSARLRGCRP